MPCYTKAAHYYVPAWKRHGCHPTLLRLRDLAERAFRVDGLVAAIPIEGWAKATMKATIKEGGKDPI
jgi:hypothetical protein